MIGLLGTGGIACEAEKARPSRAWRATAILGMLAVPLAAAGVTAAPAAASPIGYTVTATIGMDNPVAVGVDPSTHAIYVANGASGTVSVINGATNTVTATIRVGIGADAVAVDPSTHTVYVASEGSSSNNVAVINGATNAVTATIEVGNDPVGIAVDPSTHTVYVANANSNTVSVINGATNTVTATIYAGIGPSGVGVDPSTHAVYVADGADNINSVSVIDGTTKTVTGTIVAGASAAGVAVDPSTHTVYVSHVGGNPDAPNIPGTVSVIDEASNTVTTTVNVQYGALGVAVDPVGRTVFVASSSNHVSLIDENNNTVIGSVGVTGPQGVGVDLSSHTVYATYPGYAPTSVTGDVYVITPPQLGPTNVTATPGNTATTVSWQPPPYMLDNATVAGYTASTFPGNQTCSTTGAMSCTITGLTNLTTYSITVIAHTTAGDSAAQSEGVNVIPWGPACPCTLWPPTAKPAVASSGETNPVNVGVQFTPAASGSVAGIRFYKGPGNTGTHTGELWTAGGTLLGKVTFTGESGSGWQEADFSSPVAVTAGTTYVASYFAPSGDYSYTGAAFASSGVTNGPLTAPQSSSVTPGNGVYAYGASPGFPNATYNAANYWVDVVFTMPAGGFAPTVTASTPGSGSSGNPVTVAPTATFSQAVVPSSVSFTLKDSSGRTAAGSVSLNGAGTVATFTPSSPLAPNTTYTATVSGAQETSGATMSSTDSWTFTTAGSQCPCSLWPPTAQPAVASVNDTSAANLGVQFTPAASGWIAGIRFYKGAGNTGTHTGELWTASGTLLGQVTFTGESASGWQEADFSSPIAVTAGTTYVASYFAPNGNYSYTGAAFANSGVTNGPLTAPQSSAVSPGNGVYNYGGSPSFPNSTYNAANYWVDVAFTMPSGAFALTVTASTPDSGSSGNPIAVAPTATFSQAVVPSSVSFTLKDSGGNVAAGSVSLNGAGTVATFTPSSALAPNTTYTATVSGAQGTSGVTMSSTDSWSFTTAGSQCPCNIFSSTAQPAVASVNDTSAANLGLQFTPAASGWITGIRFYKSPGNTGTHTGGLWTASGTLLGQVTFTGESASGWQEADFSSPIAVTAGTTYVASYFAPNGGYAYTAAGLASAVTNGPLTAPQSSAVTPGNGVYNYGGSPSFPNSTYNEANYWVDVAFTEP